MCEQWWLMDGWEEYEDGPWATEDWHFPAPDVRAEAKGYIQVEACEQGFLVTWDTETLAFTDRVDVAEWLLGWLGFEDETVESVRDVLAGLWDADELVDRGAHSQYAHCMDWPTKWWEKVRDSKGALGVARAAQAFIERNGGGADGYNRLVKAVRKWRGIDEASNASNLP